MAYEDVYEWVRDLLTKTDTQLPNDKLTKWVDSAVTKLRGEWTDLPAYDELDAEDVAPMDEALGFLVAAKMRPFTAKSVPVTDLVRVQGETDHFEYAKPKMPAETLEETWLRHAYDALARVSVIAVTFTSLQSVALVQGAGPRRAQLARGVNTRSFDNPLATILADEWDYQAQNVSWWVG